MYTYFYVCVFLWVAIVLRRVARVQVARLPVHMYITYFIHICLYIYCILIIYVYLYVCICMGWYTHTR